MSVATRRKGDSKRMRDGFLPRDRGHIGPATTWKLALILLFILSGSSAAQPQAVIDLGSQAVPLNRRVRLTLEIKWTGEADAYDVAQPDLSELTEFEVVDHGLFAERKGDTNVLRHTFILQPLIQGEFDAGRIRLKYSEKDKDAARLIPLPWTPIKTLPPESFLSPGGKVFVVVGAFMIMAMGAAVAFSRRKTRGRAGNSAAAKKQEEKEKFSDRLGRAASLKIEGEFGAYMEELCAMAESDRLKPFIAKLDELGEFSEKVRFGGLIPSPDQLSWAERKVNHAIRMAFPVGKEIGEESESD